MFNILPVIVIEIISLINCICDKKIFVSTTINKSDVNLSQEFLLKVISELDGLVQVLDTISSELST
jgi:hypothetical protein